MMQEWREDRNIGKVATARIIRFVGHHAGNLNHAHLRLYNSLQCYYSSTFHSQYNWHFL
jgi:hypothetical protein